MLKSVRRVVTGHNQFGRAIIQSDAPPTRVQVIGGSGPTFHEIWNTRETPVIIDRGSGEPVEAQLTLTPPRQGTRIRVLDIPPETEEMAKIDAATAAKHFAEMGAAEASTHAGAQPRHPYMHRTETVDYGIVLDGEITLIVDEGETTVRTGDIVVQRGTNHGWANRSGRNCRIAFVLIDGQFAEELK